jgi:Spy/CpxP family protein refolding chaperone
MKPGLKNLLIGFCFGLLAGGLVARFVCPEHPHHMSPEKRQERILKKLTHELKLTDDQRKDIAGILADARKDFDAGIAGMREAFDGARAKTNARIREKLTPEQQTKFDKLTAEMEKRWKERRGEPPPPPR